MFTCVNSSAKCMNTFKLMWITDEFSMSVMPGHWRFTILCRWIHTIGLFTSWWRKHRSCRFKILLQTLLTLFCVTLACSWSLLYSFFYLWIKYLFSESKIFRWPELPEQSHSMQGRVWLTPSFQLLSCSTRGQQCWGACFVQIGTGTLCN